MSYGERGDNVLREELVARFADLYIDEYWAEIFLHSAAEMFTSHASHENLARLKTRARAYGAVTERLNALGEGIDNKVLYGDLVIGEAIGVAQRVREERSKRTLVVRLDADLERVTAPRPVVSP